MKIIKLIIILTNFIDITYGFNQHIYRNNKFIIKKNTYKSNHFTSQKTKVISNNKFLSYNKFKQIKMSITTKNRGPLFVADLQRRTIMNVILLTGCGVPIIWMLIGFLYFLVPPSDNNSINGIIAKDANGEDILESTWIKKYPYPERSLVQGLKQDAHYIIVNKNNILENYAINAVCTHLGCIVPWNKALNKFICPCHGSQYDETGKVIRGPAPKSLALANLNVVNDKIILSQYNNKDFRDNSDPWWIN